jgi:hypothetical protein
VARPPEGYYKDQVRIISNTEALNLSRVRRWSGKPESWDRRRTIGSAVHNLTAILDVNGRTWADAPPDWLDPYASVDREVEGFVLSWEACKREYNIQLRNCKGIPQGGLIEHTLFAKSGITEFATTLDRVGLEDGRPAIIELKTPKVQEPYWGPQLAGQEIALIQTLGPPTIRPYSYMRLVAQLFASGKCGKLVEYKQKTDYDVFLWSLGIAVFNLNAYGADSL